MKTQSVLPVAGALVALAMAGPAVAQEGRLHPQALIHSLPGTQTYPESVTVDHAAGAYYVGSVKEGTIFKGQVGQSKIEVFSPAGADGRVMATGMFFAKDRLIVAGRQTGLIFIYNTQDRRLISKLDNGLRTGQTFLNDTTFARDGSAFVTDSINPVLYRVSPGSNGQYELQEFLKFEGTPVKYINAQGPAGINVNGIVATDDGRYLIIAKRNENALYRIDLQSREIVPVKMPENMLDTPDGMYLQGDTLFVAQNNPRSVAVVRLAPDFASASLERSIAHPTFAFPTSVAVHQNKLLVVSSQFDTKGSPAAVSGDRAPVVPFWVSELPLDQALTVGGRPNQ